MKQNMTQSLIITAANLADHWHAGQIRKASLVPGVPYLSHLMEVAGMVQGAGGTDEAVAAAWLHDVLEDTNCTTEDISVMPDSVISLILECTEIGTSGPIKAPWQDRKDAYLAHLATVSAEALLIVVADKLQSLRGLKQCVRVQGQEAYRQLVKSAPTLIEQRRLTLWFNAQVWQAILARHITTLREEQNAGLEELLTDFEDVLRWLEAR
jgi:(p)ppGpp synthase/HD superfamily hydrolase